ncbi:MAG: hypothetical protein JXR96_17105 [Deltaproteobacteria bacterium]|nr:hypothetical protein [Deltaproteobacteria bacterium]
MEPSLRDLSIRPSVLKSHAALLAAAALGLAIAAAGCSDSLGPPCDTDADCPPGQVCFERHCRPADQVDGGREDGGGDHGDVGSWDAGGPAPCENQADCAAGERCFHGYCVTAEPDPDCSPTYEDDCTDDRYCETELGGCVSWEARTDPPRCEFIPPEGEFTPVEEWVWEGDPTEMPEWNEVIMTPVVVDLTGTLDEESFAIPAVLFNSFNAEIGYNEDGVLRALAGDSGEPIFSVTDPAHRTHPVSGIAAGDLDGDRRVEIVTGASGGGDLVCFDAQGGHRWTSQIGNLQIGWGGPAIANLDAEGPPEIVLGATVLNADGTLRWQASGGSRGENPSSARAPFSVPVDVDGDGKLEIVTGDTLYDCDGGVVWERSWGDGFVAVADFNGGGTPEIVVVARGTVRLQSSVNGEIHWLVDERTLNARPECDPNCGMLGPPTVADFDGDGKPDIGVAGAGVYIVIGTYGSVLWSVETRDGTSNITGSAVFDFEGDRRAEVVYADEVSLKVFRGRDGQVLYEQPHSSVTACEYPVIADVDGDFNAEIVIAQNDLMVDAPHKFHGLRVFGDASDNWVDTRRIWNQHAYFVTNVGEGGSIPLVQSRNWVDPELNNFRQNAQGGGLFDAPDLTARGLGYTAGLCYARGVVVFAAVANRGDQPVPPGVPVAFYRGDPREGGVLLGVVHTSGFLSPGEVEVVAFVWTGVPVDQPAETVYVVADDRGGGATPDGIHSECREANNVGHIEGIVCRSET